MSGTPAAEVEIGEGLVRRLLAEQHPDLAGEPITLVASGWDNAIFRLGQDLAVRVPRRAIGAALIASEQRWLPVLAPILPLPIPAPVRVGAPGQGYPWAWSVTPWFEGETADLAPPDESEAEALGGFFRALHRPAPADAPVNPYRGVPLIQRAEAYEARRRSLEGRGEALDPVVAAAWRAGVSAPPKGGRTWVQGDPHPRNLLVRDGKIAAVLDWGDLCAGDRASDLASVWMVFHSREARAAMKAACGDLSEATWARARGWAALYAVMLLDAGLEDDPRMAQIARRTIANLRADL